MSKQRKLAFRRELDASAHRLAQGDVRGAFAHLERAHILGQLSFLDHVMVHIGMLRVAFANRDALELRGQFVRLLATVPGHLFGWVPIGNTGGANVSALRPMPIPADLTPHFRGFSLKRQIARQSLIVAVLAAGTLIFAKGAYARPREGLTIPASSRRTEMRALIGQGPNTRFRSVSVGWALMVTSERESQPS